MVVSLPLRLIIGLSSRPTKVVECPPQAVCRNHSRFRDQTIGDIAGDLLLALIMDDTKSYWASTKRLCLDKSTGPRQNYGASRKLLCLD